MIKKIKSLSVLYKYIISYFLVIILPLGLLTYLIYNDNIASIRTDFQEMNLYRLEQAIDIFEARFKELHIIAYNIATDYRLKPDYLKESKYKAIEGIEAFNLHSRTNSFTNQMFLYYRDMGLVYSKDGVMNLDTLTRYYYSFTSKEQDLFSERIKSITEPFIIPARIVETQHGRIKEGITFLYPVPLNSKQPYGTLVFSIERETISNLLRNILGEFKVNALILDKNMNPVIFINNEGFELSQIVDAIKLNDPKQNIQFNGKEYSLIYTVSESTNWNYSLVVPIKRYLIKVVQKKTLIFQIAISVLVLGVGLSLVFARANYRPIRKLMSIIDGSKRYGKYNEIDRIKDTVLNYVDTNRKLQMMVDSQSSYAKERIFELLLDEKISNDEANRLLSEAGIPFDKSYYCVMAINNHQIMNNVQCSRFHQSVLTTVEEEKNIIDCYLCAIERVNEKSIIIVMNFSNLGDEVIFAENILKKLDIYSVLTIGKIYDSVIGLKRSFIESMAAMEYSGMKRKYGIVKFDEISNVKTIDYWYPMEEQLRFEQAIKQGDTDTVLQSLNKICTAITEKNNSVLMIKYICFDIVNTVIKIIIDINLNNFPIERLQKIMSFNSLDEFKKRLETILLEICEKINARKASSNTELRNKLIEFVDKNFRNYDLSLESVAEKFSLSANYISRFFSEQTNCTFKDYLTKLRIEETKRLLTLTDRTVSDIVQEIGYTNVSSFIRKFKKEVGLTPGEYRKVFRNSAAKYEVGNKSLITIERR